MTELFERIPEEKRERILQAAINEFASCGYDSANTNEIAKKAGISIGSLYKYFGNKEDMFLTTVDYFVSVLRTTLDGILETDEDIILKVEKVIRTIQRHSRENASMIQLYNVITTHSNSKITTQAAEKIELLTADMYSALIEKERKENKARLDCDPRMFAFFLDNLFMMLQFSYACDYYRDRFKLYVTEDIFEKDDFVVEQMLKFIKAAFTGK